MADGNDIRKGTPVVYEAGHSLKTSSYIIPRAQMAAAWGQPFGGRRNMYEAFGYPATVRPEDIFARYMRGGIARRIVDAYPDATWGAPPEIVSDNKQFTEAWNTLTNDFDIWSALHRLDILSRLGQYAILLVGTDKGTLSTQLRGAKKLVFLQPYGELSARIQSFDTNQNSERFQRPAIYEIVNQVNANGSSIGFQTPVTGQTSMLNSFKVHHSRAVHVAQGILENEVYGVSTLMAVWNYLIDLEKIGGAAAENFWTSANRGMQLDVDKDMELDPADAKDLSDEVDEYIHNLRRVIRTRGIKINPLGGEVSDPRGPYSVTIDLISGTTGIPRRILLGTESGHLASTQDKGNWAERIEEYRTLTATPYILDPFIWTLVNAGLLPDPGVYEYQWPDAYRLGPMERGQQSAQTSRTFSNLVRGAKEWQGMSIQRTQLRQMPTLDEQQAQADKAAQAQRKATKDAATAAAANAPDTPAKKGLFGRPAPTVHDDRTPVEDDLAHETSGQQSFGGQKSTSSGGSPKANTAGPVTANPAAMPVDLPDIPPELLSQEEMRNIIGLSTDNKVLNQNPPQVIKGKKRR